MRVVLQRVKSASCTINNKLYSEIKEGYALLVGFGKNDTQEVLKKIAKKIIKLRVFSDENNKMNCDIFAIKGQILSISQFTLYADTNSGNRPSFINALEFNKAKEFYAIFNEELRSYGVVVKEGIFGEDMLIDLQNDGPVTIIFDEGI